MIATFSLENLTLKFSSLKKNPPPKRKENIAIGNSTLPNPWFNLIRLNKKKYF
jgi:hypothetical protein